MEFPIENNIKITFTGGIVTSLLVFPIDEIDENVCHVCQALFDEEDEDKQAWIGCDSDGGRWYYYWCAGFKRMPSNRTRFICLTCQNE